MPKQQTNLATKILSFLNEFPNEFEKTPKNELFCSICNVIVKHDRRSTITKHRESYKHSMGMTAVRSKPKQSFVSTQLENKNEFLSYVARAFLSANIPIYKANNPQLKFLFNFLGKPLPSESTLRAHVASIADIEMLKVRNLITGQMIFIVIDETDIYGKKYFNTLIGTVSNPDKTYLLDCRVQDGTVNHQYVVHLVDNLLRNFQVERHNFCLLLSDAARYMVSAGNVLKELYPRLLHVTCVSHLFHNCAEKIRGQYSNVDNLIARVKASIVKNKERKNRFYEIGIPPEPVITRWTSWLKAAIYYADNLPEVRNIVNNFNGNGLLVIKAKEALLDCNLAANLLSIKRDYECVIQLVDRSEKTTYNILSAYQDLTMINFGVDSCGIKQYLDKRLKNNTDLVTIATLSRLDIAPTQYHLIQKCQASSASVERSFSMLKKLLAKDRPFNYGNIHKYFCVYYNSAQEIDNN